MTPDPQFAIILDGCRDPDRAAIRTIGGTHLVSHYHCRFGQLRQLHIA